MKILKQFINVMAVVFLFSGTGAMAQPDDAGKARILSTFKASEDYALSLYRNEGMPPSPAEFSLDRCQLVIKNTSNPDVFGSLDIINPGDLELESPYFVYEFSTEMWRLDLKTSDRAMILMAPAIWRYMGNSDKDRPSIDKILEASKNYDPLAYGEWADPSMMTWRQQRQHDANWEHALDGEGSETLQNNWSGWYGPGRWTWRPVYRTPGNLIQTFMPPDEIEPFLTVLRVYTARACTMG